MGKIRLWKNRKMIKLYAFLAITIITAFQGYWLYTVYESKKSILVKEAENLLRETVITTDSKRVSDQLSNRSAHTTEIDNVSRELLKAILSEKAAKIKVSIEGEPVSDSVSREMLGKLASNPEKSGELKSRTIFLALQLRMAKVIGQTGFSVYHFKEGKADSFPKKMPQPDAKTSLINSEMEGGQSYQLYFENLTSLVLIEMLLPLLLSVVYMIIYISAVVLLIVNVNKSRKLMEQKDNFTNNMTHEFKTPMATISAALEAFSKYDILSDRQMAEEYLQLMEGDLKRLISMTDEILYNAKVSDGRVVLQRNKAELHFFLSGIINNLKPVLDKKEAEITVIPATDSVFVRIDEEHFGNVFRNLIDNSVKYTDGPAKISIAVSTEGRMARILFSDNGMGIPDKYKGEIFKPYFRIMEKNVHTVKGYGLGLNYVREIISLHDGRIQLVSGKETTGATFEILIPLHND